MAIVRTSNDQAVLVQEKDAGIDGHEGDFDADDGTIAEEGRGNPTEFGLLKWAVKSVE